MDKQISFPQIIERGAGMDVHRDTVVVTVMGTGIVTETKTFTTYTNDLRNLGCWLQSLSISHLAIESTGIYWKPVFNILDDEFEILLVNAKHVKNIPGIKQIKRIVDGLLSYYLAVCLKQVLFLPLK